MNWQKMIRGKKILIVDDEKDVLEMMAELLGMCKIDTALTFEEGKRWLEEEDYDVAPAGPLASGMKTSANWQASG